MTGRAQDRRLPAERRGEVDRVDRYVGRVAVRFGVHAQESRRARGAGARCGRSARRRARHRAIHRSQRGSAAGTPRPPAGGARPEQGPLPGGQPQTRCCRARYRPLATPHGSPRRADRSVTPRRAGPGVDRGREGSRRRRRRPPRGRLRRPARGLCRRARADRCLTRCAGAAGLAHAHEDKGRIGPRQRDCLLDRDRAAVAAVDAADDAPEGRRISCTPVRGCGKAAHVAGATPALARPGTVETADPDRGKPLTSSATGRSLGV